MQKTNRLVITVDYDDVIAHTSLEALRHYNQTYGTCIRPEDFYSKDPAVWGTKTFEDAVSRIEIYYASDEFQAFPPTPDAIATLTKLSKQHELHIVTGRSEALAEATERALDTYLPGVFTSVEYTSFFKAHARSKADVCRQLKADILIDDNLHHSEIVAATGIKVLLFGDYPWNRAALPAGDITRVASWQDIEGILLPV